MVKTGQVDRVLAHAVASGAVPGVIALAATDAGTLYAGAFGKRSLHRPAPMLLDTVCWFVSMTKAITSVAAMQLVERGMIGLDEPLGAVVPELAAVLDGVRILRPETVAEMRRNQIGEIRAGKLTTALPEESIDLEFFPEMAKGWGLGWMITPEAAPTGRAAGSLSWAGMANSCYWLDPVRRVAGVLLIQIMPFADCAVLALFAEFERAIYGDLA